MGRLLGLTAPLFFLVLLGYALARWGKWPKAVSDALTQFAFTAAVPALLFQLMSGVSRLPPVDARVLIEWARHRSLSWSAYVQAAKTVITNPVVASIFAGTLWGLTGLALPGMIDQTLTLVGQAAIPLSLIALGMGLAEYRISEGWRESTTICALKLGVQPIIVWLLARVLTLPALETQAIVML